MPKLLVLGGNSRFLVSLSLAASGDARRPLSRRLLHGKISGALCDPFACFGAQGVFQGFLSRLDDSEKHCHPLCLLRGEEACAAHWLDGFDMENVPQRNTLLDFKNQGRIERVFFPFNLNSLSFETLKI